MEPQQEFVLKTVEERGVRLIRLWFTDVLGQLKSVAITPAELETAFEEGVQFDGSAIDGFSRVQEADVLAVPDAGIEVALFVKHVRIGQQPFAVRAELNGIDDH